MTLSHYCGKSKSVDEYIAAEDEEARPYLEEIRGAISKAISDVTETISWGMPTYKRTHNPIHFAVSKKHIGIYNG